MKKTTFYLLVGLLVFSPKITASKMLISPELVARSANAAAAGSVIQLVPIAEEEDRWEKHIRTVEFAEKNFFGAALLVAKNIRDDQEKLDNLYVNLEWVWDELATDDAKQLLDLTLEKSRSVASTPEKFTLLWFITKEYLNLGNSDYKVTLGEIETFADQLTGVDLIRLADLYGMIGDVERERELLEQATIQATEPQVIEKLAETYTVLGLYDQALELLKKVEIPNDFGLTDLFENVAIFADVTVGWELIEELVSLEEKQLAMQGMAVGRAKVGDLIGAMQVFSQMEFEQELLKNLVVQEIGYQYQPILSTEEQEMGYMLGHLLTPTEQLYFYNGRINANLESGERVSEIEIPLAKLQELAEREYRPELNIHLAGYYQLLGQEAQVEQIIRLTQAGLTSLESAPRVSVDESDQVIIEDKQVTLLKELQDQVYNQLIPKEVAVKFLKLLETMVPEGQEARLDYLIALSELYIESDAADQSQKVMGLLRESIGDLPATPSRVKGLAQLARGMVAQVRYAEAQAAANLANDLARRIGDTSQTEQLFDIYLTVGDYSHYQTLVQEKADYSLEQQALDLFELGQSNLRQGQLKQAKRLFAKAVRLAEGEEYYLHRLQVDVALEYCKMGEFAQASKMLTGLASERQRLSALPGLLDLYVQEGEPAYLKLAQTIAHSFTDPYLRDRGMQIISFELMKLGDVEKSFQFLRKIDDLYELSYTLTEMGIWHLEAGREITEDIQEEIRETLVEAINK